MSFQDSSFVQAIEMAIHTVTVVVFKPEEDPEKDTGHSIQVDQRITLLELKENFLQPLVPELTAEEFQVGTVGYASRLVDSTGPLISFALVFPVAVNRSIDIGSPTTTPPGLKCHG